MNKISITAALLLCLIASGAVGQKTGSAEQENTRTHDECFGMLGPDLPSGGGADMAAPGMIGGGFGIMGPGTRADAGDLLDPCIMGSADDPLIGRDWTKEQHRQFLEDTVELRKKLHDRRFGYMEVMQKPGDNGEELARIGAEIKRIRNALYDAAGKVE